ncbi:MAG: hypothetical protein HC869_12525 [Rhodospirillales bacterium]|nr:hypothetical protein [Rhodospirillales bacterium]
MRDENDAVVGDRDELETFPKPYDMTMAHDTTWTIVIPGRGSLIGHELERVTPEYIKLLESIRASGKPWTGSYEAQSSVGPAKNGMGVIVGGTGEFERARGYMTEENHFRAIDVQKQVYVVRNRMTFYFTSKVPR